MTPYQKAELSGKIEWVTDSALDAAHKQNWQEFDRHMEKVSELRASLPVNDARTIGTAILQDTTTNGKGTKVRIGIEKDIFGLVIHPDGTGTYDGSYAPILLEQHEGTLRLIVWGDINVQDPTHIIDLYDALESKRTEAD